MESKPSAAIFSCRTFLIIVVIGCTVDFYVLKDIIINAITKEKIDLLSCGISIYFSLYLYSVLRLLIPLNLCDLLISYISYFSKVILFQFLILIAALYLRGEDEQIINNLLTVVKTFIGPWGLLAFALDFYMEEQANHKKVVTELSKMEVQNWGTMKLML